MFVLFVILDESVIGKRKSQCWAKQVMMRAASDTAGELWGLGGLWWCVPHGAGWLVGLVPAGF